MRYLRYWFFIFPILLLLHTILMYRVFRWWVGGRGNISTASLVVLWTLLCIEIGMFTSSIVGYWTSVSTTENSMRRPLSQAYAGLSIVLEKRDIFSPGTTRDENTLVKMMLRLRRTDGSEGNLTVTLPGREYHYVTEDGTTFSSSSPLDSVGLGKFLQDWGIDVEKPNVEKEIALVLQAMLDIERDGFIGGENWLECREHFGEVDDVSQCSTSTEWLYRRILILIVLVIALWLLGISFGCMYRKKTIASPVTTSD